LLKVEIKEKKKEQANQNEAQQGVHYVVTLNMC